MEMFAVGNGHTCDSNHPHMPLMPTGKDPGKPLSWVDPILSLVETVMTGRAGEGMMSGKLICYWKYICYANHTENT